MRRRNELSCVSLILLLLLLSSIATVCVVPVFANELPKIYVDPPSIIDPTLTPPKTFTIKIWISNVTGLYGYSFRLYWDKTLLSCISAVETPPAVWGTNWFKVGPGVVDGMYDKAVTALYPAPAFSGSWLVLTLTFKVMGIGSCVLNLVDTKLADSKGDPLPHSAEDGYFNNYTIWPAKLYVYPPSIYSAALEPCQNFTIDIRISDAINLYGFDFKLGFNKTILEATEATEGPFLKGFGTTTVKHLEINNTGGYVWISISLTTGGPASGNGILANVTFHVLDVGESVLDLYDTKLIDDMGGLLPHHVSDGYFNNRLMPRIFVDPPSIIDPTLLPPATFKINISICNMTNMYDYVFKLGYNTKILNCLSVDIIPFNNEFHFTPIVSVNDPAGIIYINVTYFDPAPPITAIPPATFVTIKFQVTGFGASVLDLYDIYLSDPTGASIPHWTTDGVFVNQIRDVAILSVKPSTNVTYAGWLVNITVVAGNEGDVAETFNVSAYHDDNLIGTQTVNDLPSGENETLIFAWNTAGLQPCINYTIKAEASTVPYEMDTADNEYVDGKVKIKMLGDVNGDGVIDIYDLAPAGIAFGSRRGDPKWNPEVDLRQDGIIDVFDLVIIGIRYGKKC